MNFIEKKLLTYLEDANKTILYNALGAFLVKGLALLVSLLTMPAYIRYFDNQQILGLWFTIISVLSWVLNFDLGVGNGLRNNLTISLAKKDILKSKKYISSAYFAVSALVLLLLGILPMIVSIINWNQIFNISQATISADTLNVTVGIILFGTILQFFSKLITSILYAMQKSAITNFLSLISSIIILLYVLSAETADVSFNIITMAVVHVLAFNIPLLIATVIVFRKMLKDCRPHFAWFEKECAKDIMKLGGTFFWIQIMYMVITTTNEFLITWLAKPEMVVEYRVYYSLSTLPSIAFSLALTPIWSAVTKAFAEQNYFWIKKLYNKLKIMGCILIACEFIMIFFLQFIINLWLDDRAITVNYIYAFVFAINASLFIWNGVVSSIANGIGQLKIQTVLFTVGAVIKIPVSYILVLMCDSWIGVLLANIVAISCYCFVEPIFINKFLRKEI